MDTKYKVNWKLTIRWIIFNIGFSFWWKLFWKRSEDNNTCSVMCFKFVCPFLKIWHYNLLCHCSWQNFVIIKTFCLLQVVHKAKYISQNIELQIMVTWVHLSTHLLFVIIVSPFRLLNAENTFFKITSINTPTWNPHAKNFSPGKMEK